MSSRSNRPSSTISLSLSLSLSLSQSGERGARKHGRADAAPSRVVIQLLVRPTSLPSHEPAESLGQQ
jgi:hypothetical protein